jgi:hypothetical protein
MENIDDLNTTIISKHLNHIIWEIQKEWYQAILCQCYELSHFSYSEEGVKISNYIPYPIITESSDFSASAILAHQRTIEQSTASIQPIIKQIVWQIYHLLQDHQIIKYTNTLVKDVTIYEIHFGWNRISTIEPWYDIRVLDSFKYIFEWASNERLNDSRWI